MKLKKITGGALRNGQISQMVMKELCERWSKFIDNWRGALGVIKGAQPCKTPRVWVTITVIPRKA